MNTIILILEADADGTVRVPVPVEFRHGRVEVTATLRAAPATLAQNVSAAAEKLAKRKAALSALRNLGGLHDVIPNPASWQREIRLDRTLPEIE